MSSSIDEEILVVRNEARVKQFVAEVEGKKPLFICVIATTDTAKIPGISAAGKNPQLTDYTPAADVEFLLTGKCRSLKAIPVTPEGIPTPAVITREALRLAAIPLLIVNAGAGVKPQVPSIDLRGKLGSDIREGKAVEVVEEVLENAELLSKSLAELADYLVVGESIPGGTTTALAVMLSMGIRAEDLVSSSMPNNPHKLKMRVVEQAMKAAGIGFGELESDPLQAISAVGDPMMPAFAGLILGAAGRVPVLMAGGTQMGAILAILKALDKSKLARVAVGTTRWIIEDRTSDLSRLVKQAGDVPIIAANLHFEHSKHEGLRAYESGAVKEGVGAGGACIAAMLKSRGAIKMEDIAKAVELSYERIVSEAA